tara:strand:+ start:2376 stop:2543 length:168 start_codon:yes stop_codon:yes gene_type:complete
MTIHFKNRTEKEIPQEIAEILKNTMIPGSKKFQIFSDPNGKVLLFVNVDEIVFTD